MIKRLQKRFIRIATLAVAAVLTVLCLAVNLANAVNVNAELREMLQTIAQAAQEKRFDVIICPNPDRPEECQHVLIPERGLAFVTTNARMLYEGKPYRRLRLDAMAEERLTRAQKAKLRFIRRVETSLLEEAVRTLTDAANAHDTLEAVYRPCIDFSGVTALAEEEIARLIK